MSDQHQQQSEDRKKHSEKRKKHYNQLIKLMEEAHKVCLSMNIGTERDIQIRKWQKIGAQNMKCLKKNLRMQKRTIGEKNQLQTVSSHSFSICRKFNKAARQKIIKGQHIVGGNIQIDNGNDNDVKNLKWDELPLAFNGRMRTGVITNINHIDLHEFLLDAREIFIMKIREMQTNVKSNVILACKYENIKESRAF
ncbi:hypothetical protein PV328_011715 [Microctonus aethiopoides]|uniref:Uncharacterized protein n=1 Tax=Microctonus aethiopoides TaxID=144406 RepID=A0AA39FHH1_9HYME|nr:hypothetical protein PV328_011715 [Microctonus aethiopoides]